MAPMVERLAELRLGAWLTWHRVSRPAGLASALGIRRYRPGVSAFVPMRPRREVRRGYYCSRGLTAPPRARWPEARTRWTSALGMVIHPARMMSSSASRVTVSGANCDVMREDLVSEDFDVIVVGTGAGGGTLAHTIAQTGKRILLLERGDYLPKELDNWQANPVFVDGRYISSDTWYDGDGTPFQPQTHYFVGGATKMYGAALYRLRPEDFGDINHVDGISPAWPLS